MSRPKLSRSFWRLAPILLGLGACFVRVGSGVYGELNETRHLEGKLTPYDFLQIQVRSSDPRGLAYAQMVRGMLTNQLRTESVFPSVSWEDVAPPAQSNPLLLELDIAQVDRGAINEAVNAVGDVEFRCSGNLIQMQGSKLLASFETRGNGYKTRRDNPNPKEEERQDDIVKQGIANSNQRIVDYLRKNR